MRRPLPAATVLAGAALLALAACSGQSSPPGTRTSAPAATSTGTSSSPGSAAAAGPAEDWLQYHGNETRSGTVARMPAAGRLSVAWSASLGGAVYGQPVVIGTTVVAATEADEVFGLSRATGAIRWHTSIGTPVPLTEQPCGNVNPLGITSTPVYDPQTGLVYVVAQDGRTGHVLAGLQPSDGRVEVRENVPSPDHQPFYDQQRGALALTDGYVYVVFGGHYGDCGPYIGSVVGMPATGKGPVYSYLVPTPKQGGIWAAGGPVVGPSGTIYVSSGNGGRFAPPFDGSDSVIALTPQLKRTGVFAPVNWAQLSTDDLDLGSMSPALTSAGLILQVGKSGVGYLLNAAHLGGVGGQIAQANVCVAFGGAAVAGSIVYVPCISQGIAAVDTAGGRLRIIWHAPPRASGSPVVGGGAVWVASAPLGILYELAPATGQIREQITLHVPVSALPLSDFVSPALSGGLVLIGTMAGVTAVAGA